MGERGVILTNEWVERIDVCKTPFGLEHTLATNKKRMLHKLLGWSFSYGIARFVH